MGAWVDLIGMAMWEDNGELRQGQMRASIRFLAERWNWSKGRVSRFLSDLEGKGRIRTERERGRKPSVLTVLNYSTYQGSGADERDANEDTDKDASRDASRDANEDKDEEEEEEQEEEYIKKSARTHEGVPPTRSQLRKTDTGRYIYPEEFNELWNSYPDRQGGNPKGAAYAKWRARVKDGVPRSELQASVEHYAQSLRQEGKEGSEFVLMGSTFFGPAEHFLEYVEPPGPPEPEDTEGVYDRMDDWLTPERQAALDRLRSMG